MELKSKNVLQFRSCLMASIIDVVCCNYSFLIVLLMFRELPPVLLLNLDFLNLGNWFGSGSWLNLLRWLKILYMCIMGLCLEMTMIFLSMLEIMKFWCFHHFVNGILNPYVIMLFFLYIYILGILSCIVWVVVFIYKIYWFYGLIYIYIIIILY